MNGINGQNNEDNSLDIEYGMTDQPDIEQNATECPDPVQNFLGYLGERGLKIEAIEGQLAQLQVKIRIISKVINVKSKPICLLQDFQYSERPTNQPIGQHG